MAIGAAITLRTLTRLEQGGANELTFVVWVSSFRSAFRGLLRFVTLRVTERAVVPFVAFCLWVVTEDFHTRHVLLR